MPSAWDEEADDSFGYLLFVLIRFVVRTLRRLVAPQTPPKPPAQP